MSRSIFTIPQALTYHSSGSASTTAPATNLLNNEPGIVFRSTALSGVFVQFSTSGQYDVIALVGTNLTGADTVRIRASNSEAGLLSSPAVDVVVSIAAGRIKKAGAILFHQFANPVSYQFIRIDFASLNASGYVEASRLVIGLSTGADGIDTGAQITYDNTSKSYLNALRTQPTWKMVVSGITEDAYWGVWDRVMMDLAEFRAFLFIPDSMGDHIQPQSMFCRFVSAPKTTITSSDYYEIEMNCGTLI